MKTKLSLFLFLLLSSFAFSQTKKLAEHKIANINHLKSVFKSGNINAIAQLFQYPFNRTYPIPDVKNNAELKKRYAGIFDKSLVHQITTSTIDQWSDGGWRGIMLDQGTV